MTIIELANDGPSAAGGIDFKFLRLLFTDDEYIKQMTAVIRLCL